MRINDKIITAGCLTPDGIEWTSLNVKQEETEPAGHGFLPMIPVHEGNAVETAKMTAARLPDNIGEQLTGDLTVSIRTSELLMRTMEFPTADSQEIASMVKFQIDKISPFPLDQLAVSHEILKQSENGALVLMVAARRDCIDDIGDIFEKKGLHIHSMDARVLGWLHLLESDDHLVGNGCEILIIDDEVDFALVILLDGLPVSFRSLHAKISDEEIAEELAHEIGYSLTTLDAEYDLPVPSAITIWSLYKPPSDFMDELKQKTGLAVHCHDLAALPPLSKGIISRAVRTENRIELIPREWVDHQENKRLQKKFALIAAAIAAVWLVFVLIFTGIYQTRAIQLSRIKKRADAIAPAAATAFENREKLKTLKIYTDRSNSALECLREVTSLLPPGDIEFASFNYNQGKGVTIRGSADTDDPVYDFFNALTDSPLFEQLKDQSVNTRNTKGLQRSVFSATLMLPSAEETQ
ncbi:MAG TPA: pilus assembly protein PilM, partial [Pontiella sp.]|nr:pilus assembly protein PilM [Pontiella sp.]